MELHSIKKAVFLILAVLIGLSVILTIDITAILLEHECVLANCPICQLIKAAKCFLKTIKLAAPLIFLAFSIVHLFQTCPINSNYYTNPLSQIVLKVRFNT